MLWYELYIEMMMIISLIKQKLSNQQDHPKYLPTYGLGHLEFGMSHLEFGMSHLEQLGIGHL